jgi:hypothetical protein
MGQEINSEELFSKGIKKIDFLGNIFFSLFRKDKPQFWSKNCVLKHNSILIVII